MKIKNAQKKVASKFKLTLARNMRVEDDEMKNQPLLELINFYLNDIQLFMKVFKKNTIEKMFCEFGEKRMPRNQATLQTPWNMNYMELDVVFFPK